MPNVLIFVYVGRSTCQLNLYFSGQLMSALTMVQKYIIIDWETIAEISARVHDKEGSECQIHSYDNIIIKQSVQQRKHVCQVYAIFCQKLHWIHDYDSNWNVK